MLVAAEQSAASGRVVQLGRGNCSAPRGLDFNKERPAIPAIRLHNRPSPAGDDLSTPGMATQYEAIHHITSGLNIVWTAASNTILVYLVYHAYINMHFFIDYLVRPVSSRKYVDYMGE